MNRFAPMLSGTASLRAALLPAAVLLSIGLLLAAGCSKDEDSVAFPVAPEEPPYLWYYDVYGTSANDVWVVGNLGMMYHYDGLGPVSDPDSWSREELGTHQAITCLYGASDGTVFAAGYGGSVWRNAGSSWTGMSTGTSKDLYGMGLYKGDLHAVGQDGAALRYDGGSNSWHALPGIMVTRNPKEGNAVTDTLYLDADVVSLKVVNHYMIGGAFFQPDWPTDPEPQGLEGTVGFYINDDTPIVCSPPECDPAVDETGLYDWLLTSLGDDPLATPEWIISGLSSDTVVEDNWFGTSKGWLFRLSEDQQSGTLSWLRYSLLPVTREERHGVRDLWQASNGDIYIVTDDGLLVHQQADGTRNTLYDQLQPLVSVWGTGPDNLYLTGYMDEQILHVDHDPVDPSDPDDDITIVTPITLNFPDKAFATASETDELGRPRF